MDARLIIDAPAPGAWNMAVDEALFRSVAAGQPPTLRLYRWSEPTLSLGYFQSAEERASHGPSRSLTLVRRATGGGAIVHDVELTYSLTLGLSQDRPAVARQILAAVHESLASCLHRLAVPVRLWTESMAGEGAEPFLCFRRRTAGDLVLDDYKIAGSAQRRYRFALLQHGSILLRRSMAAPELPGIEDLRPLSAVRELLVNCWPGGVARALDLRFEPAVLTATELELAEEFVTRRFAARWWNEKR
jgi:lipoate-protein ligase A